MESTGNAYLHAYLTYTIHTLSYDHIGANADARYR